MGKQGKPRRHQHHRQMNKKSLAEKAEVEVLERALAEQAPARGTNPFLQQQAAGDGGQGAPAAEGGGSGGKEAGTPAPTLAAARKFEELPLSRYSKDALRESKFVTLTAIQRAALPHALCGRDVLGAAKTGSGKTLAFLLPVVEKLYRTRWTRYDGLGALVISPTRELALQIFDELRKVGKRHEFSAGLLIGGKDVKEEQSRVAGMNILVCTPGRLLQHMDETPGFDASNLQILVLDEADRILDMGFSATLNAIVDNIPRERQTLLFSATQTKSVKDLARLSLKDPEYISVHAEAATPTPLKLQQAYMVCPLQDKMDILWSFIKTHLKAKVIVFVSTCKQVRFLHEAFRKLRPGVPLRALHGRMNQYKRMGVFYEFCEAKAMVLFATDIAARGLDFPTVDWVVQADCPEDVASYIHRVGRTARYVSTGRALLLLLPSERDGMLKLLEEAKIPIKPLKHNPAKLQPVTPALQALLSKDQELKEIAQRALISYLRSVFLQPNHEVFDVAALPAAEFALSMGLPTAPKLRFLRRAGKKVKEVSVGGPASAAEAELLGSAAAGEEAAGEGKKERQRGGAAAAAAANGKAAAAAEDEEESGGEEAGSASEGEEGEEEDDLLVVKRRDVYGVEEEQEAAAAAAAAEAKEAAAAAAKKKRLRIDPRRGGAAGAGAQRVVFDEEGEALDPLALLARGEGLSDDDEDEAAAEGAAGKGKGEGLHVGIHGTVAERAAAARALMAERDRRDKEKLRELRKALRDEKKAKRKAREAGVPVGATLAGPGEEGASSSESEPESDSGAGYGSDGGASGSSDSDAEGRGARWGRGGGGSEYESDDEAGGLDVDLLASSDDEEEPAAQRRRGANREAATLGMLPAGEPEQQQRGGKRRGEAGSEGEEEEAAGRGLSKAKKKRRGAGLADLPLAEQEALALRLLGGKR